MQLTQEQAILRAARICVRDHQPPDLLERKMRELEEGPRLVYESMVLNLDEWRRHLIEDYVDRTRWEKTEHVRQPTRAVSQVAADAEVLGPGKKFETVHARENTLVIRMTYGRTWMADYEVSLDSAGLSICWQD